MFSKNVFLCSLNPLSQKSWNLAAGKTGSWLCVCIFTLKVVRVENESHKRCMESLSTRWGSKTKSCINDYRLYKQYWLVKGSELLRCWDKLFLAQTPCTQTPNLRHPLMPPTTRPHFLIFLLIEMYNRDYHVYLWRCSQTPLLSPHPSLGRWESSWKMLYTKPLSPSLRIMSHIYCL